jgi:transcriptional regulator with XRE-family HTH domain
MSKPNNRKKFGKHLKKIRKAARFSQEELGKKSRLHRTYIGSVERGQQNISLDNIYKIANALKITPKDLFDF